MKLMGRILAFVLALITAVGLLTGCAEDIPDGEELLPEISADLEKPASNAADNVFSLNCNREFSFNPITATNTDNIICTQLMYDNVFEVDSSFSVSSGIISEYSSNDGFYWSFTVDTSVKFWDGSTLTAQDVAYSIQLAKQSPRHKSRLASIYGVTASDESHFAITLYSTYGANMQLPSLLTVPVIKYGSVEEATPQGTGPFMPDDGFTRLSLFSGHKKAADMPFKTVYLKEVTEIEKAIAAFETSEIDLVTNDPTGILNLGYGLANEVRYYPTTNMHYLGFNSESTFFSNELCRRAMTYVVNREYIANNVMGGAAVEAALPMNPVSVWYNNSYAGIISYSLKKSEDEFDKAEVQDYDDDGFREIMITGIPRESEITFIVCSSSAQKVAAAQSITDNILALGIKVTLKQLTWDEYITALVAGDFDMFYAETMLTADFNPSILMTSGGALNYGGFNDPVLSEKIGDYLSAPDDGRKNAADLMNKYITDTAPIVVICFERHQVITHRGVISGMKPSQYNIFQNINEWTVDLG